MLVYSSSHALEHIDALPAIRCHLGVLAPVCIEQKVILTCATQASVVEPRWLPIVDTLSEATRNPENVSVTAETSPDEEPTAL